MYSNFAFGFALEFFRFFCKTGIKLQNKDDCRGPVPHFFDKKNLCPKIVKCIVMPAEYSHHYTTNSEEENVAKRTNYRLGR